MAHHQRKPPKPNQRDTVDTSSSDEDATAADEARALPSSGNKAITMTASHYDIIRTNLNKISKNLTRIDDVLRILTEEKIFGTDEKESIIKGHLTNCAQADALCTLLLRKQDRAFEVFRQACIDTDNMAVAGLLGDGENASSLHPKKKKTGTRKRTAEDEESQSGPSSGRLALLGGKGFDVSDQMEEIKVRLCTKKFYDENRGQAYSIDVSRERGEVLIINVKKVLGQEDRTGTDVDRDNLKELFEQLSLKVTTKNDTDDLTAEGIKRIVTEFADKETHRDSQCCVLILLSHGREGHIYGTDGKEVNIEELCKTLDNCKLLWGKPKLTIVQACRMDDKPDGKGFEDQILGHAAQEGYKAWRNTKTGSWYITGLVKIFEEYACEKDVESLLELVAQTVIETIKAKGKTNPGPEHKANLARKFYFFPTGKLQVDYKNWDS